MKLTRFQLDFIGEETFTGFTRDEEWNGFACPYFTKEQADIFLQEFNKSISTDPKTSNEPGYYDKDNNCFSFPIEGETESFYAEIFDEQGFEVYAIGAFAWGWTEIEITEDEIKKCIDDCIEVGRDEIIGGFRDGTFPKTIGSFSELHDYCDANMLANGEKVFNIYGLDKSCEIMNAVTDALDDWIKQAKGRFV